MCSSDLKGFKGVKRRMTLINEIAGVKYFDDYAHHPTEITASLRAILKNKSPISILRGKWINWDGRLVMPIFHPAYLLRNQSKEKGTPMCLTKSDFLKIKEKIDTLK